jgi:hypothetical protein
MAVSHLEIGTDVDVYPPAFFGLEGLWRGKGLGGRLTDVVDGHFESMLLGG